MRRFKSTGRKPRRSRRATGRRALAGLSRRRRGGSLGIVEDEKELNRIIYNYINKDFVHSPEYRYALNEGLDNYAGEDIVEFINFCLSSTGKKRFDKIFIDSIKNTVEIGRWKYGIKYPIDITEDMASKLSSSIVKEASSDFQYWERGLNPLYFLFRKEVDSFKISKRDINVSYAKALLEDVLEDEDSRFVRDYSVGIEQFISATKGCLNTLLGIQFNILRGEGASSDIVYDAIVAASKEDPVGFVIDVVDHILSFDPV